MKNAFRIIGTLGLLLRLSCAENVDSVTRRAPALRNAILADDMDAVLAMTSERTQNDLETMHRLLNTQKTAFESDAYSLVEKMKARATYPKESRQAETPSALFRALVAPRLDKMNRDEALKFGMTSNGTVTPVDLNTLVSTHSGQSIAFVNEDGEWKTTAFETSIHRNLLRVEANAKILDQNLKALATAPAKEKPEQVEPRPSKPRKKKAGSP